MAIVVVNKNIYKVDSLYQWDINQVLEIQGLSLPTIPEIHFTNDAMDKAIVRQATMDDKGIITVEIPNSLLQKPYKITAYVCIYEDETFKSLYKLEIPVKARKKPMDYTIETNDNEIYSFNAIENLVNNTVLVLTQKCDDTIAETENIKETAIVEMNDIKNEAIEECEKIKEELQGSSFEVLEENIKKLSDDMGELRNDFDNQIETITPISQIVEGSTKPITSGAVHSLKSEIDESLGGFQFKTVDGEKQVSVDGGLSWENFSNGVELLWTNPTPNAKFTVGTTVDLDLSRYNYILFTVKEAYNASADAYGMNFMGVGETKWINYIQNKQNARLGSFTTTETSFAKTGQSSESSNADYGVPLAIYGLKNFTI